MNIRTLKLAAGAGDPDDALALRIDVVAAAEKLVAAVDNTDLRAKDDSAWLEAVDLATSKLYKRTKRYQAACRRRAGV